MVKEVHLTKKTAIVLKPSSTQLQVKSLPSSSKGTINTSKIVLKPVSSSNTKAILNPAAQHVEQGKPIVRPAVGFRVRVSNIAYDIQESDILASFQLIGKVLSCSLNEGTAVVTFDKKADASAAIEKYHGGDIRGRKLYLDFD